MDRIKRYHFTDDHGHPLENCVDFISIFTDHAAEIAAKDEEIARLNRGILAKDSVIEELTATLNEVGSVDAKARAEIAKLRNVAQAARMLSVSTGRKQFDALYRALADLDGGCDV